MTLGTKILFTEIINQQQMTPAQLFSHFKGTVPATEIALAMIENEMTTLQILEWHLHSKADLAGPPACSEIPACLAG